MNELKPKDNEQYKVYDKLPTLEGLTNPFDLTTALQRVKILRDEAEDKTYITEIGESPTLSVKNVSISEITLGNEVKNLFLDDSPVKVWKNLATSNVSSLTARYSTQNSIDISFGDIEESQVKKIEIRTLSGTSPQNVSLHGGFRLPDDCKVLFNKEDGKYLPNGVQWNFEDGTSIKLGKELSTALGIELYAGLSNSLEIPGNYKVDGTYESNNSMHVLKGFDVVDVMAEDLEIVSISARALSSSKFENIGTFHVNGSNVSTISTFNIQNTAKLILPAALRKFYVPATLNITEEIRFYDDWTEEQKTTQDKSGVDPSTDIPIFYVNGEQKQDLPGTIPETLSIYVPTNLCWEWRQKWVRLSGQIYPYGEEPLPPERQIVNLDVQENKTYIKGTIGTNDIFGNLGATAWSYDVEQQKVDPETGEPMVDPETGEPIMETVTITTAPSMTTFTTENDPEPEPEPEPEQP